VSDPLRRLPDLAAHLATALAGPLPGARIHDRLSPRLLDGSLPPPAARERPASVLMLLFPRQEAPHIVLTVRSAGLRHHADQVSLPGGRPAEGESAEETALREAHEEIGVVREDLAVAGRLTPVHIGVSGFTVQPIVALAETAPVFVPAPREVAAVLEVPLAGLADPGTLRDGRRSRGGVEITAPYFTVGGHQVWGATAMLLGELLAVCGWDPPALSEPRRNPATGA
jgi:8-oxo-dGTP pyrophosphatase MutT (NUDIX family)